ncbi:hypothetical protein NQZ68_028880 [Dissostichus eleginoides]|nr:hypothetical protein NQZ68_028880 [Dissostichus eleginoides]
MWRTANAYKNTDSWIHPAVKSLHGSCGGEPPPVGPSVPQWELPGGPALSLGGPYVPGCARGGASGGAVGAGLPGPGTVGTQWGPVAEAAGSAPEIFAGGPCCLAPLSALTFVVILDEPEVVATASRVSSPNDSVKNVPGVKQFYDTVETLYNFLVTVSNDGHCSYLFVCCSSNLSTGKAQNLLLLKLLI